MTKRLLALLLWFVLVVQATVAGTITPVTINKRSYYRLKDFAANYKMSYVTKGTSITLTLPDKRQFLLTADKVEAKLFGTVIHLTYPVAKDSKGAYCISKIDYDTYLFPILHPSKLPRRNLKTIVLDPGHGGKDNGAERGAVKEKNLTLVIANRVAAMLRKRGYKVLLTRTNDKALELADRTNFANNAKADLFVSIHFNAHKTGTVSGVETYVPNPAKTPSFLGKNGATAPSNKFDKENALLGYFLERRLAKATGATDRGLKRVQHYVTRNVRCPAALMELGFISNPTECAKFTQSAYLDKLAGAICDGIQDWEKSLKPPVKKK